MPALISSIVTAALAATSVTWTTANSVAAGDQDTPAVAANRNGRVAVVWEDKRDNVHADVYLRVFQDGTAVFEKKLSAGGTSGKNWQHRTPDVGLDDRGDAVVVWAEDADGNAYFNVSYRVVSPAGSLLSSGTANANSAGDQLVPKVAVDPDGTPSNPSAVAFTVGYEDVQGSAHTVRAAGFTGGSTRAYDVVASQSTGSQRRPDVAVSAAGNATVVWEQDAGVGLVQLAKADGAVTLSRRTANATATGAQSRPAVAETFAGDFVVAWAAGTSIRARSFTAGAAARHADVAVSTGSGAAPSVGIDDRNAVVVGWTAGGLDGWLRGLNPDGTATGRLGEQTLTQTTTGRQDQFAVAVSPWSEVVAAYTDDSDGNGSDQIMLGTGAGNDTTYGDSFADVNPA
jgi:hypothetical protein